MAKLTPGQAHHQKWKAEEEAKAKAKTTREMGPTEVSGDGSQNSPHAPFKRGSAYDPVYHKGSDNPRAGKLSYSAYTDPTDAVANLKKQYIEIYHVPTGKNVFFKAFVTAFVDNFTAEYNKEAVFGRMDPIATYKRTGRVINLSWDVPSSGLSEAKENLAKANLLISMLYPVYETSETFSTIGRGGATTMKSGPLFRIKMGNLIIKPGVGPTVFGPAKSIGLPGIIEGFSYQPKLDEGTYDPGIISSEDYQEANSVFGWQNKTMFGTSTAQRGVVDYDGVLYPQTITANISFVVLHDTALGWEVDAEGNATMRNKAGQGQRFPYGGDNHPVEYEASRRGGAEIKQSDWESFLDLKKDIMKRRAQIRVTKMLGPARSIGGFFGADTSEWHG